MCEANARMFSVRVGRSVPDMFQIFHENRIKKV